MEQKRRHRQIFDEKIKVKHRLHSLYSFIDSPPGEEVVEFILENKKSIFSLFDAGYHTQYAKINDAIPPHMYGSKHVNELLKIYACMRKILLLCGRSNEWWLDDTIVEYIVTHISKLLRYKNDHRIRLEGFRLLVLCLTLNPRLHNDARFLKLFLASLILNPYQHLLINVKPNPALNIISFEALYSLNDDNVILSSSTSTPTSEETCEFFDTVLYSLVALTSNSPSIYVLSQDFYTKQEQLERLKAMLELIKVHFLNRFFPEYHQRLMPGQQPLQFCACPPEMLRSLVSVVARYVMLSSSSPSRLMLYPLLVGNKEPFEYTLTVVKASLLESFEWPRTVKYGLHIVKLWMLMPEESQLNGGMGEDEKIEFCIDLLRLLIKPRKCSETAVADAISIYIEAIDCLRSLVSSKPLLPHTSEIVLDFLFQMHHEAIGICAQHSDMYGSADLISLITETLLVSCIRLSEKNEIWARLEQCLEEGKKFMQTVTQWRKVLKAMSIVYCHQVLSVRLDACETIRGRLRSAVETTTLMKLPARPLQHPQNQHSLSLFEEVAGNEMKSSSGSDLFESRFFSVVSMSRNNSNLFHDANRIKFSQHPVNNRELGLSEYAYFQMNAILAKTAEFAHIQDLSAVNGGVGWTVERAKKIFRLILNVLGNVNSIEEFRVHSEAMQGLINCLEVFLAARSLQPAMCTEYPPLYEFVDWLLECFQLSSDFLQSKCISMTCLGKLFLLGPRSEPQPPADFNHRVFKEIISCLEQFELPLVSAILDAFSGLFAVGIPGVECLVGAFTQALIRLIKDDSKLIISDDETIINSLKLCCSLLEITQNKSFRLVTATPSDPELEFPVGKIHAQLLEIIHDILTSVQQHHLDDVKLQMISTATLVIHHQLSLIPLEQFNQKTFEFALSFLLQAIQESAGSHVLLIAIDSLSSLTHSPELVELIPKHVLHAVIEKYLGVITDLVYFSDANKYVDLSRLLYGLLDWIVVGPKELLPSANFLGQFFDVLENVINDARKQTQLNSQYSMRLSLKKTPQQQQQQQNNRSRKPSANVDNSPNSSVVGSPRPFDERSSSQQIDLTESELVREVADCILIKFLDHINPLFQQKLNNDDLEMSPNSMILSLQEKSILVVEETDSRLSIRLWNSLGKYSWEVVSGSSVKPLRIQLGVNGDWQTKHLLKIIMEDASALSKATISGLIQHFNDDLHYFTLLKYSPSFIRDLRGLDKRYSRECIKAGLIYVGPGQEDEQSILSNHVSSASEDFLRFASSLGWLVDAESHRGFMAGLERNGTTGTKIRYFANELIEMTFHDLTIMPNDVSDIKQIRKKRHIGNDHVHIVWNEHCRSYRSNTFGGDFGTVQIIITPLERVSQNPLVSGGFYSIEVRKSSKSLFGPLCTGMIVDARILGPLVRSTAINAYRSSLVETGISYRRPGHYRLNDIRLISERYRNAEQNIHQQPFNSSNTTSTTNSS